MESEHIPMPIKTMRDVRKPSKKSRIFYAKLIAGPEKTKMKFGLSLPFSGGTASKLGKYLKRSSLVITGTAALYIVLLAFIAQGAFGEFQNIKSEIPGIRASAENLNTEDVASRLSNISVSVKNISDRFKYSGMAALSRIAGVISPTIGEIPGILSNAASLNFKTLQIAEDLDTLKSEGAEMMLAGRGEELIGAVERIEKNISEIIETNSKLAEQSKNISAKSGQLASIAQIFSKNYIPVNNKLSETKEFLGSFGDLLKYPEDQHILLMFQNPTEMRPAGGFIGSFGVLTINRGNLKEVKIDDIYNADRQLNLKLLPPKELRGVTPTWGARDANWFFDFPTSAKKVISLLEESDLFKTKSVRFQGAIAINTNVLQSLISATGPITLENYEMTIDRDNFLKEIQREVEQGRDKKPGQNPKKILSVLSPILIEKLSSLSGGGKSELISDLKNHMEKKDIMIYFDDTRMQNFFESYGIAGNVLSLPENHSGDYLAVVNANIAGGKTDAVTSQHISIQSTISADGKVLNQVSITRAHSGKDEKDWWYSVANKNYLKLLVPENAKLLSVKGNDRVIHSSAGSDSGNLKYDSDLASIEKTATILDAFKTFLGREFGKFSFGAWMTTQPGQSKTITMQYQNGVELKIHNNMKYEFIFEKQSGAEGSLEYSIAAPPGYVWKETGKSIFEYGTQQIMAREIISLTLLKV